jgi:hypothetical protein
VAAHCFDELGFAKTKGRPIAVNGHLTHGLVARLSQRLPAGVAIELAAESLGGRFGLHHPKHRIANGGLRQLNGGLLDLLDGFDECQCESDLAHRFAFDSYAIQHLKFHIERGGRVQNMYGTHVSQVEFFEQRSHAVLLLCGPWQSDPMAQKVPQASKLRDSKFLLSMRSTGWRESYAALMGMWSISRKSAPDACARWCCLDTSPWVQIGSIGTLVNPGLTDIG